MDKGLIARMGIGMNQGLVLVAQVPRDSSAPPGWSSMVFGPVRKIIGLLGPKAFCHLIDMADLSANPRSAKRGSVTTEIEVSLDETPELFPAKTKGILLASSSYRVLDRQRYQLTFEDTDTEGILDGGHNALAIGRHVLREAGLTNGGLKKVADWSEFVSAWKANRQAIADIEDVLSFHVPIEIQVPAHMQDRDVVDEFRTSLLEIGAARNNNVQLTDETKANKQGLYDELKGFLPADLANRVEWKANEEFAKSWNERGLIVRTSASGCGRGLRPSGFVTRRLLEGRRRIRARMKNVRAFARRYASVPAYQCLRSARQTISGSLNFYGRNAISSR